MQTQTPAFRDVGLYFSRLGLTGFGGPIAVVAQMERDLAGRWIDAGEFAEAFGAIKTLPGPVAFQMVTYLGYRRLFDTTGNRWKATVGALIAAGAYVFPAMVMILLLASTRTYWVDVQGVRTFLVGLQAAAIGLIASSVIPLSRANHATGEFQATARWLFVLFGFVVALLRPEFESLAILFCGILALAPHRTRMVSATALPVAALIGVSSLSIHGELFLVCLRAGALVFGSGLAIVPALGGEFVDRLQWLSHAEFLEALSFGQMTPGPILITATYIGAKVAGIGGGITATIAIFLVPFVHMTTWFPIFFQRVRKNEQWRRFSFGAISAVIGAVVAGVIKLLEPIVLSALEVETLELSRPLVALLVWISLPILSFYLIHKKKRPAWAVLLASGAVSFGALCWY